MIVGREAALLFPAVSSDGSATAVFDVMSFDDDGRITANGAYWPAERPDGQGRPRSPLAGSVCPARKAGG